MLKTGKKILCTFLIVVMCLSSAPLQGFVGMEWPDLYEFSFGEFELPKLDFSLWFGSKVNATEGLDATGQCGDNVYWNYNSSTGELTISGTGDMYDDYFNGNYYVSGPFEYNENIKSIYINEGVTSIGEFAFRECRNLNSVVIPNSVRQIDTYAFQYCENLSSIKFPSELESIGQFAFEYCKNITSISIPSGVKCIDRYVFSGCSKLSNISLHDEISVIEENAFTNTAFYNNTNNWEKGALYIDKYLIAVDESVAEFTFKADTKLIASFAFGNCDCLTNVVIPEGIPSIEDYTFYICDNLTSITIPNSVTSIGDYAFCYCSGLKDVFISKSLENIGVSAFYGCDNLTDVYYDSTEERWYQISIDSDNENLINANIHFLSDEIPSTTISGQCGDNAYYSYDTVTQELVINGSGAIWDYEQGVSPASSVSIKNVVIEDGITAIGNYAFYGCSDLTNIDISDDVTVVGCGAFKNCISLTNIVLPEGLQTIGDRAFESCLSMKNIDIPYNVSYLGAYAFSECTKLESVVLPEKITALLDSSFEDCMNLESIDIPNGVKTIGNYAFNRCIKLKEINLPNTLTDIEKRAFSICVSLTEICIPQSVVNIGELAFKTCISLKDIYVEGKNLTIGEKAFGYTASFLREGITLENLLQWLNTDFSDSDNRYYTNADILSVRDEKYYDDVENEYLSVYVQFFATDYRKYDDALIHCYRESSAKEYAVANEIDFICFDHLYTETIVKEATCIEEGEILFACECGDSYVETIPSKGENSYKVGDIIQFGSYPQSEIKDEALIFELNSIAPEWNNWISYGYYSGDGNYGSMRQGDWMRYTDVMYNGNKYRGVKFTQYRPNYTYSSFSNSTHQNDNNYRTNTVYWFKFDPIAWRVLHPATGLIMCETLIDSQPYNNTIYSNGGGTYGYFNDSLYKNYANDYETSSIRKWLNNDFYNIAFTDSEKNEINATTLNNAGYYTSSGRTGYEDFDSNVTNDKIFLLSYNDARNSKFGFSSSTSDYDKARQAQGSDYAKCQGLYVSKDNSYYGNSNWLLRSPGDNSLVCCDVYISGPSHSGYFCRIDVTYNGVRPALCLDSIRNKHNYISSITTQPTHLKEGMMTYTCECGDSYTETIEKLKEHTYVKTVTDPTCTSEGYTTYTCVCGDTYVMDFVDKLKHAYLSEITKPATHLEEGVMTFTCKCGDTYTEVVAKLKNHTYASKVTKEPTHLEEGIRTYTCECLHSYTESIGKLTEHTYETVKTVPTCVEKGYTTYICVCGDSYVADYLDVIDHIFTDWVVSGDKLTRRCTVCTQTETKIITSDGDIEIVAPENPDEDFDVEEVEPDDNRYLLVEESFKENHEGDYDVLKTFDINLKNKDGVHVQPKGTVKVKLPLDWNKSGNYKVYRVNPDGTLTDMNAYRQGSHMVFETNHFSIYVIVDTSEKREESEKPSDQPINCSHMCHKGGFMGFIWKIVRFFWKLFRMNPICECGVKHY